MSDQRNKAFAIISGNVGTAVEAQYVAFAPEGSNVTLPGNSVVGVAIGYSSTSEGIHQDLADAIRDRQSDPDLIVIFLDSPGRY